MLAAIRQDIRAAKERDPAAPTTLQVVIAYPGVHAIRVRSSAAACSSTMPPVW
jgi:serine acetyltransferase